MNNAFTITVAPSGGYLYVRYFVPVTRELARQLATAVSEKIAQAPCNACLVDVRGIPNISSISDNYAFATQDLAEFAALRHMRLAILINLAEDTHDFPQTAMRDAGYDVRLFSDEQKAIAWLEEA